MTTPESHDELLRLTITGEQDVFLVRQRGREVGAAVGLESQDQIRVATVLSDLGRDLVKQPVPTRVVFRLRRAPVAALTIELSWQGGSAMTRLGPGWNTAGRLMDDVRATHQDNTGAIVLVKNLPSSLPPFTFARLDKVRRELAVLGSGNALDELRAQNQELLDTLEKLESKQKELVRLNEELEETNRGVVALYKELTDELEQTNRGVVALYAELDEKSIQLREASEAKNRFWSNISHELRTPINSVVGLARLLSARGPDPLSEEQRRQVRLIEESGSTLLVLVNELLDTAKAESGRLEPQVTPVDLGVLFLQLRGTLRPVTPTDSVRLVIEDPPPLPPLLTDEVMLGRILRNLLSNALKFTEDGEVRLTLHVDSEREELRFVVADTGIGIPATEQAKVFEEFHQVPNELQARSAGTGLGLPYARRLTEILDGELTLTSDLGGGTEVTLRLPARHVDLGPVPTVDTALLVDDDADFRSQLREMLHDLAHTVVEAGEGRAALDSVADRKPDLIFLDLTMPVMGGGEVLGILRQDPDMCDIPVVVVTAADPDGLDLTGPRLRASVLRKSQLSAESIRNAVAQAFAAAPRTVSR
jgi:signal transduction histidine kinase/CheY-like chemotaxis protein